MTSVSDESDQNDEASHDPPRWAADEPTAMWTEASMQDEGYGELVEDRAAKPRAAAGPATGRDVGGADAASVRISADATGGHEAAAASAKSGGISWLITVAISLGLGVGVYFLVRLLR